MMSDAGIPRYLIDGKIIFNPSEQSLFHIETLTIKIMKPTESRCLLLLLEKQGVVVSQNEAMAYSWGEKHREISFNTFYQCILVLRKTFAQLDASGSVITTIPRKGVMVDESVSVEIMSEKDADEARLQLKSDAPSSSNSHPTSSHRMSRLKLSLMDIIILLLTTAISTYILWPATSKGIDFFSGYQVAGMLENKCQYYFNKDTNDYSRHKDFLHHNPELCQEGKVLYITAYSNASFISAISCDAKINSLPDNYCRSFYYPEIFEK